MDDTTINTLDQTDEEILTYTVSDEALEAAAEPPSFTVDLPPGSAGCWSPPNTHMYPFCKW